jgi:hypothetical protein
MLAITADGLQELSGKTLKLQPNRPYYMGASSSPNLIVITSSDENWTR